MSTDYGQFKLPVRLYAIWENKGWFEPEVLADMAVDGRWRS